MLHRLTLARFFLALTLVGLATGSIALAQHLRTRAALRHLLTDEARIVAATTQFSDRYQQLPGDFAAATGQWGRDAEHCVVYDNMPPDTSPATPNGACNGDGDGLVESTALLPTAPSEFFQFWRHLALAGLIAGPYTGLSGGHYAQCLPGYNCPALSARGATAMLSEFNWQGTGTNGWWGPKTTGYGNWLVIGLPTDGLSWPFMPVLSAREQADLDSKTDDGKPGSGTLMAMGCQLYQSGCMSGPAGEQPPSDCDHFAATAHYQTRQPGLTCTPMWRLTELDAAPPVHR